MRDVYPFASMSAESTFVTAPLLRAVAAAFGIRFVTDDGPRRRLLPAIGYYAPMRLYIGYMSAAYFWLRGSEGLWSPEANGTASLSQCAFNVSDVDSSMFPRDAFGPKPLHIMVDDAGKRHDTPSQKCHVWTTSLARKCFVPIGHDVLVASPAFCFLQLAKTYGLLDLLELGYELCGRYSRTPGVGCGFIQRSNILTTPDAIERLVKKLPHAPGHRAATRVCRYLAADAASPAETDLALKLRLPPRLGGYGFPPAGLNQPVVLTAEAAAIAHKRVLYPDMLWHGKKVCVEYDSSLHHESKEDRVRDSLKRNALGCMGYSVTTVTPPQLTKIDEFHGVALELARGLGIRIKPASQNTLQKRYELNEHIKRRMAFDLTPIEWPYAD